MPPRADFWAVPAFLPYLQPPLTRDAVAAAEAQLGVRLPATYLELLLAQNGGYTRGTHGLAQRIYGIGPHYPSLTLDDAWWRPKNADQDAWAPPDAALLVPFEGDGHWDMCLDYRVVGPLGEPSVTFVDCECEREEPVAESFAAYLDQFTYDRFEEVTRIYGSVDAETVARGLAAGLGAPPPTVSAFDHGYPIWRVRLGANPWEWLGCAPNRVPRGFRREGDEIVVTEEMAMLLPEDPQCAVILLVGEVIPARVGDALAALGLVTRSGKNSERSTE